MQRGGYTSVYAKVLLAIVCMDACGYYKCV